MNGQQARSLDAILGAVNALFLGHIDILNGVVPREMTEEELKRKMFENVQMERREPEIEKQEETEPVLDEDYENTMDV